MKSKFFLVGLIVILFIGNANAQWNWPDDKAKAETKNALYTDSFKQGNFRAAANHLSWLLINAPDLNKSIYINGVKIYDGLASEATDEAQKVVYQDSVLLLYDLRIKHFNQERASAQQEGVRCLQVLQSVIKTDTRSCLHCSKALLS
jgi:hypothetical protein